MGITLLKINLVVDQERHILQLNGKYKEFKTKDYNSIRKRKSLWGYFHAGLDKSLNDRVESCNCWFLYRFIAEQNGHFGECGRNQVITIKKYEEITKKLTLVVHDDAEFA